MGRNSSEIFNGMTDYREKILPEFLELYFLPIDFLSGRIADDLLMLLLYTRSGNV